MGSAASSLMSTPAWKPLPSARRITTRTSGSRPAARSASASSNQPATGSAFTGGLSIVTVATCVARLRADHAAGSLCEDAAMNARIDQLARRAHARREGGDGRRCRPLAHGRGAAARHPGAQGHRRAGRRARRAVDGSRVGVVPVRHRARRDVEPRARAHGRRAHRRRGAAQGCARAARADGQHPSPSARGPQLRVLLRRSVPLGAHGGRVHQRRAVDRRRLLGEALRRQRLRVRAHDDQLRGRRRARCARSRSCRSRPRCSKRARGR